MIMLARRRARNSEQIQDLLALRQAGLCSQFRCFQSGRRVRKVSRSCEIIPLRDRNRQGRCERVASAGRIHRLHRKMGHKEFAIRG